MTGTALPEDYGQVLDELATQVRASRAAAHRAVNAEMLALYRNIGRTLLDREQDNDWNADELDRLAVDLQRAFPETTTGLSRSNLRDVRAFAPPGPTRPPCRRWSG